MGNNTIKKLVFGFANLMIFNTFEKSAEEEAIKYSENTKKYLSEEFNVEIISSKLAVSNLNEAIEERRLFESKNVDAVILFYGTFSLTNVAIEIIRNLNCPFLIWGLEEFAIKRRVLAGSMIGLMPAGSVFRSLEKRFTFIYGNVGRKDTQEKLKIFIDVIKSIVYLRESKIGLIGARPDGFEISGFDELAIKRIFGTTINKISMSYYLDLIDSVDEKDIDTDMKIQKEIFDIRESDIKDSRKLSGIYLATKKLTKEYGLNAIAPQCWPELRVDRRTPMCPANGRITADGTMASCECDMDCALTMLLLYALTGNTPWTADFLNLIEEKDAILWWHCGNASYNLSDQKPFLEVVYEGLAQTAAMRAGKGTVCRINHYKGGFELFAAVGEVIDSKPMLKGSNMFMKMAGGNMEFIKLMLDRGIPHHNAIVYGDVSEQLEEFANLMNLPLILRK